MKKTQYFANYFKTIYQNLESIDSVQLEQAADMVWAAHKAAKKSSLPVMEEVALPWQVMLL